MSEEATACDLVPRKGLTLRHGQRESNVHDVKNGVVYYGVYLDGDDWPAGLYRVKLIEWYKMARAALTAGASVFTLVRPQAASDHSHCARGAS